MRSSVTRTKIKNLSQNRSTVVYGTVCSDDQMTYNGQWGAKVRDSTLKENHRSLSKKDFNVVNK